MIREIGQIREKIIQLETKLIKKSHREDKCRFFVM